MLTIKSSTCRLVAEGGYGILYRIIVKIFDGKLTATIRRYRMSVTYDDMTDRNRRAMFKEDVENELMEALEGIEGFSDMGPVKAALKEGAVKSTEIYNTFVKVYNSPYGIFELYDK